MPILSGLHQRDTHAQLIGYRDALALIAGIQTCKIGLESNMTSNDYPIIRLVPSSLRRDEDGLHGQMMDLLVYYGEESHEFEDGGIQAQYEWLMDMESTIKRTMLDASAGWVETILDEDGLPGYKLFCSRFEVR